MSILVLFQWIALSAILVSPVTVEPGPRCDANHTRLLLLVDVRHDINLTITRLKNIVSYFITKVKDGIIKTLDVCLVDPFQEKTLFNLTKVNSTREITSVIGHLVKSNVSLDKYQVIKTLSNASMYFQHNPFNNIDEHKQYVVVILLHCTPYNEVENSEHCSLYLDMLRTKFNMIKDVLMVSFLIDPFKINYKSYNKYYRKDYSTDKHSYLVVDNDDDFTKYNPVTVYACRECPQGWIRYSQSVYNILSCYYVDKREASISWIQASNLCVSMKSHLPMFETENELMYLKNYLRQTKVAATADLNVSLATSAVVYTGLMLKQYWTKKPSFTWMNAKPFILDFNLAEMGDDRHICVVLTVPLETNTAKRDMRWKLVRCDKRKSRLLVCEMDVSLVNNKDIIKAQLKETIQNSPRRKMFKPSVKDYILSVFKFTEINIKNKTEDGILFVCRDGDVMITYSLVCDGRRDCPNGRDERYCKIFANERPLGIFLCENPNRVNDYPSRGSVPLESRCDGVQDCPDESDEKGCNGCLGRQCKDGTCLPSHWLSRDFEDCNLFIGANRSAYINVSYSCISQCSGLIQFFHEISFCNRNIRVDEYSLGELLYNNSTNKIEWAPKCLYLRGSDERPTGCLDAYQLRDCTTFECPEGFIKCINSYCVPVYNVRDGVFDCPFGEDEELDINMYNVTDIFTCESFMIHIHKVHICDGVPHCPKGEDETDCPMTCPIGFKCYGGSVVVTNYTPDKEIKSLNIFDIKTKFLNLSGIDLSKLNETFIIPNLLEIQVSNCNLVNLDAIFDSTFDYSNIFTANFSYNKLESLLSQGPLSGLKNLQHLDLSHNKNLTVVQYERSKLIQLHTIDFSFTRISQFPYDIQKNDRLLLSINLCNTNFSQVKNLLNIKSLEFLNLEKTSLGEKDMTKLLKSIFVTSALYVDNYKYCCPQISTGGTPKHVCHAPPDAFSSCEDLLSDSLKRSLLWLVAAVSLAGNIVVITYRLFYDRVVLKKGYGIFVTNLSLSDFVMGVYLLIIAFTDVRYRDAYVLNESVWRHSALCQTAGFLSTLSSETSTFFVFLITLDRCLVIKFPFGDHWFTKWGLVSSVLSVWILGVIFASIPLMNKEWIIYSSNGMCLGLPLTSVRHAGWHYSFGIFICLNFVFFLCIVCGQIFIFYLISSSQKFQMTNAQSVARRVQDINVAKQLLLVALSNFLCWFPICVLGFWSITVNEVSPDTYAWLVVFVMPLNAAVNPMIYTIPVIYSKWQDLNKGKNTRIRRCVKPTDLEAKF